MSEFHFIQIQRKTTISIKLQIITFILCNFQNHKFPIILGGQHSSPQNLSFDEKFCF